ncbi:MAG: SCO6745 family protein [Mycobacteriales bacterium]
MPADWTALSARASFASHRLIGWIYWDPLALESYRALGLEMGGVTYIASRAAPLAPAGAQVVAATFYSISPEFIAAALQIAEQHTTYEAIIEARNAAVVDGLRAYVPDICDSLAALAAPLWAAADALPVSGRALFAAHRQQPRPADSLLSAWLAVNCIREWRGDTHFAVLAAEDISATQAGLLHNAFLNYPTDWIPRSRGSDDAALDAAYADLELRGLASSGVVNDAGLALRERIEQRTDSLCELAWRTLGEELTNEFLSLVEPVGDRLVARIDETAGTEWMPAARLRRGGTKEH